MEIRKKSSGLNSDSVRSHNVMRILSSLMEFDKHSNKTGQGVEFYTGSKVDENVPQIVSLTPSEYMRQLILTTEERMELLTKFRPIGNQNFLGEPHDFFDFEAVPSIVVFQQYSPGNVYNVTLTIRNVAKAAHYLKLICDVDPAFTIEQNESSSLKIRLASGMHSTFNVRFTPEENCDYEYKIKFSSDRGNFTIPVIAIGPRAILDFPDLIVMPETAVKIPSMKSLLVRNIGNRDATFNVTSTSPYFRLEPSKGVIEEEETVEFDVHFLTSKSGFFEGYLFLTYETGEVMRIQVQGSAIDCNIKLQRGSVRMQDETYLGLSTSKTLRIFNRSNYIVKFQWMRYKDGDVDRAKKEEYKKIFQLINNAEIIRCMDLMHYNISTPEVHELVCQRIYRDEITSLMNENFRYTNSHFSLIPMEGEIWPQNSVEITVNFEPNEIGELTSTAYLELTGHQNRIPLSLSGLSIGPLLKLNVATLDVQNIFLCSVHNYEIVCANKGFIPGVLVHRPKPSDFGGNISVTPKQIKLEAGEYKALNISFSSNRNGDFVERIEFVIKESLQIVAVYIKGYVVCPTLHFDKRQLDFGTTALGFTSSQEVMLHNDSLVPVTFNICIPGDGVDPVVTHEDFAKAAKKPSFPPSPREFEIVPHEGVVADQSSLKVKIHFTPNTIRSGDRNLRVDMWDSDLVPVSLPIYFQNKVASLVVTPPEIDIRFCFLNFPYSRTFTVENKSAVEGYFYIIPQSTLDSTSMQYSMSTHQGYLGPNQSKTVSLTIMTKAIGKQKSVMSMLTFGEKIPSTCCVLTCNGQGPVVSVKPTILDWGEVELLQEATMPLTLISDSPVPAEFTVTLHSKNSSWKVFPTSGCLSPGQSIDLEVTIRLRDVGKHVDKIVIAIPHSRDILVSVTAIGIGSSIVCDPSIFPTFDMGLLFSNKDVSLPITIENQGTRHVKLIFSNSMEIRMIHGGQVQTPTDATFSVEPLVVELPAQSIGQVSCSVRCDTCKTVSEQWWLHCFFDGQGKREVVGCSTFTAKFINPSVSFSKTELTFRLDMGHNIDELLKTDEFFMTNQSGLDLHCLLRIGEPFRLIRDNGEQMQNLEVLLEEQEKIQIRVIFSMMERQKNRRSRTFNGTLKIQYKEHPNTDKINCLASVNFPNIETLPEEIRFDCPRGCSVVENIFLRNNGSLEVHYKFSWLEKSIAIVDNSSNEVMAAAESDEAIDYENNDQPENSELLAETRDILSEILTKNFKGEENESSECECFVSGLPVEGRIHEINKIFSILPSEGVVPAYSTQCIALGFHGAETLTMEAQLFCEIEAGPSELIKILAAADDVQFRLDKERVSFGQQVIWEPSRETIKLENRSKIHLTYHIVPAGKLNESVEIEPMSATIPAQSITELEITSLPVIPGAYVTCFKLHVEHCLPMSIIVEGLANVSQVYVSLPRYDVFEKYSVEFGYRAIQIMPQSLYPNNILEEGEKGWTIVINDHRLPTTIDIEMAIESLIAKEFIEETYSSTLIRSTISKARGPIPYLFAPEYVLDMGYVIVGQTARASTRVYNYGPKSVQVRLNKSKIEKLAKLGISIHFRDQDCLMPSEYLTFEVSFNPLKLKGSEKFSVIKKRIYLEVSNGFTVPIIIVATVTYPFITLSPKSLDINEVLIGECKLMYLLIKNEGLIDCQWEAKLPPARRNQNDGPFYLQNGKDVYGPGQFGSIKIYFKPQKPGYFQSKMTIEINHNPKPVIVELRGRGIEHKLKIVPSSIKFPTVFPYDLSDGKNFTIENVGQRAVEIYWQHLFQPDQQEQRVIRVLTHYYQVEEILLPPRRPPDTLGLPSQLFDFYNFLAEEMISSMATTRKTDAKVMDDETVTIVNDSVEEPRRRGTNIRKISKKLKRTESIANGFSEADLSVSSEIDVYGKRSTLPNDDPDETEKLIHCFIDDLQKQPDFLEKMKDPVKEVFDSLEKKDLCLDISSLPKMKKTCIIFHGESFTEYQQTACKTARALALPLLNLENAIMEIIAFGNTACSAKLREIIDVKYRELLTTNEKIQSDDSTKMLTIDELNTCDSLSRYEYKMEAIQDSGRKKIASGSAITTRGKFEDIFVDIDTRLIMELFEQRLAMPDLNEGFVLETLKNNFIRSEEKTLALLLHIMGDIEYPIFVTFHKTVSSENFIPPDWPDDKAPKIVDEISQRMTEIDEMSASEFDTLSDIDKELYCKKVLDPRNQETLQRRMEFQRRLAELRRQTAQLRRSISKDSKGKNAKKSKSKIVPQSSRISAKSATLELPDKKKHVKNVDSARSSPTKTPDEIKEIDVIKTEDDTSNLETILSILETWEPNRKSIDLGLKETSRSKMLKNPKRDHPTTASSKMLQMNEKFWIWHVKVNSEVPKCTEEIILNEMTRYKSLLNPKSQESSSEVATELRPQVYFVARPKKFNEALPETRIVDEQAEIFHLVALKYDANLSSEIPSKDVMISAEPQEENLEPRLVLQPHESRVFRVYFLPKQAGNFQKKFNLMISNCDESSYGIKLNASSDVPRLDMNPSCIFNKIKEIPEDATNDPTFFTNINTFDFGSLLVTGKVNKVHRKKTSFKFWNSSQMDLELEMSLMEENWEAFNIEPRKLSIKLKEFGVINVTASATKLGPNEDQLILLVEGNPCVEIIMLRSNGVKLDVELEGKQMFFGKVLLHRETTKTLKVLNNSLVPIYWRINQADNTVDPQIKLSLSNGRTKARAESEIFFTYSASQIGISEKRTMAFQVFLNEKDDFEDPLFEDIITTYGETYDVAVDINNADPINLGTVIVGAMAIANFNIKNRGPYDVNYTVELKNDEKFHTDVDFKLRKNLREDLQISPSTGTIGPEKISTIKVSFRPKFEMHFKETPLLQCNLIDANDSAIIIAEFQLTVTIASHYTRFRIIPQSEISFGPLSVCANKTLHLGIENLGIFPLDYEIKNAISPVTSDEISKKQKKDKSARADTSRQGTAKSRDVSANLRLGPFTIAKPEGSVKSGDIVTIKIDCYPETEGHIEENLLVVVEDCEPSEKPGRKINLNVDSCLPSIDFIDLDSIFQESYLVDNIEDFVCPKGVEAHTVFARGERHLYFQRIIIHKTHTASVKLYNRGTVPARVTVNLRPDVLKAKNSKPEAFVLDTVQETVFPKSNQIFAVSFTPSLLETYTGLLEAIVELPVHLTNNSNNKLSIKLSGEGCVPEVIIVEPPTSSGKLTGNSKISFGRCIVRESTFRSLALKNIGKIIAKVIVGINHDADMLYTIQTCENVSSLIGTWINAHDSSYENEGRSIVCTLQPDEVSRFLIKFEPQEIGKKEAQIQLHVLDNPYENVTIELDGEGFINNIVLVGIPLAELRLSSVSDSRSRKSTKNRNNASVSIKDSSTSIAGQTGINGPDLVYNLDYGMCFVNKMHKINFKIINKSDERYFRFQFSAHPNLVFIPSIGHLRYSESKDITATFLAAEEINLREIRLECETTEILIPRELIGLTSWDDRQENVEWISVDNNDDDTYEEAATKKALVPSVEPSHEIVTGTGRTIRILFSAVTEFSKYRCSIKEINFKDTLMFQSREYNFSLENPGNIATCFNWKIDMDVEYSKRLTESALRAGAFRPRSPSANFSRPNSRSSGGVLYPELEKRDLLYFDSRNQRGDELNPDESNIHRNFKSPSSQDKYDALEPHGCPCAETSDLFSNSAARTHRSTDSWTECGADQSFNVTPSSGLIPAGELLQITIRFSPLDVFDYKAYLVCQMENLSPDLKPLTIPMTARSLLPYCHFEVEESNYLERNQHFQKTFPDIGSGDSNESTAPRVVELKVIGTGESHEKQFYLINPTTDDYRFTWTDITPRGPEELPHFHCVYEEDLAESGKRSKIVFTFFAQDTGVFETYWRFSIEKYNLETIFLLVAIVTEPAVHFLNSRLKMRPNILGSKVEDSVIIVNDESFGLPFKVLSNSLRSEEDSQQILVVAPMTGFLEPNSQQILQVSFVPSSVGEFTFRMQCQVKKMKSPLSVIVSGKIGKIVPRVLYSIDAKGQRMREAHHTEENILDFGKLILNKTASMKFEIANIGDVVFHYNWDLEVEDPSDAFSLRISKETELVLSDSISICYLQLTAARKTMIRNHPVTLNISNGPSYRMFVKASAKNSSVEFSFIKYNFGPCYIRDIKAPPYVTQLSVKNNDKAPVIIECNFPEDLPHMNINLEPLSQAIPEHSTVTLPISFRPLEQKRYNETLDFLMKDATIRQTISIQGEGIPYKICLENLRDKFVELGHVPVGKIVTRKVQVLNAGRAPVEIKFDLMQNLPGYEEHRHLFSACQDESVSSSRKKSRDPQMPIEAKIDKQENVAMFKEMLNIQPQDFTLLSANKTLDVVVKFQPTKRINSFVAKIGAQVDSTILPIFSVHGSCVGREFRLNRAHLYFGTIVESCSGETKLVLENRGDFGAKFKWNASEMKPHFDIKPISGYCSPGMDVTFDVTLRPVQLAPLLEAEATLDIEKYGSLRITCSGACCRTPDPIETLKFSGPVRSTQTRDITIINDSNFPWNINVVLSGEFFFTEANVSIPAFKSHSCSVSYTPLLMNNEKNPHRGQLVVTLPEGKEPLVYGLLGLSSAPLPVAKIERHLPAKTKYTESLPVHNWLTKSQSFHCDIKLINDSKMNPVLYSFTGNSKLDVPASGTRDFRALFYCYKEAILNFQIKFTNHEGEYEFYEIQYKVSKPDILSTIKLTTPVRTSTCYLLQIENPLEDKNLSFTANCQHRDVTIHGIPKLVLPKKSDNIAIKYSPFLLNEDVTKLEVNCPELGSFLYELKLKATPALPEKINHVTAILGSSTTFPIVIKNPSRKSATFSIKIDEASFTCDKNITVPPDKENILEITYEPCDEKNVTAELSAVSETLGEFIFPLIGSCTLPRPQGPFTISSNTSLSIVFKNVFATTKTFEYVLDGSDDFSIASPRDVIKSKKVVTIIVKFCSSNDPTEKSLGGQFPVTGKLLIFCNEPAFSHIVWIYYLRGINE